MLRLSLQPATRAPKKKKTQLKPIARGFATTSVPKKTVEPSHDLETSLDHKDDAFLLSNGCSTDAATTAQGSKATNIPALSETDQAMQNLIDKFQDKVEKEIVRTVKVSRSFYIQALLLMHTADYRSGTAFF